MHSGDNNTGLSSRQFWDEKYISKDKVWSGKVNETLEKYVTDLKPARALDLGCGEGGDAIWLAEQGWNVLATDISQVALDRTMSLAKQKGFERDATSPDGESAVLLDNVIMLKSLT